MKRRKKEYSKHDRDAERNCARNSVFVLHTVPAMRLVITGVELYDAQTPTPAGLFRAPWHPFRCMARRETLMWGSVFSTRLFIPGVRSFLRLALCCRTGQFYHAKYPYKRHRYLYKFSIGTERMCMSSLSSLIIKKIPWFTGNNWSSMTAQ